MKDFTEQWPCTVHRYTHIHHSCQLHKRRMSTSIIATKQETDLEIAGHCQKYQPSFWRKSPSHLSLSFVCTYTHKKNLAFQSVPISHLVSERTSHLQLMVCRPVRRGTNFYKPFGLWISNMKHISKILYGWHSVSQKKPEWEAVVVENDKKKGEREERVRRTRGIKHSNLIIVQVPGTWGRLQCYGNPEHPGRWVGRWEERSERTMGWDHSSKWRHITFANKDPHGYFCVSAEVVKRKNFIIRKKLSQNDSTSLK